MASPYPDTALFQSVLSELELPEVSSREDPELTCALWCEAFESRLRTGHPFLVTDEGGRLVFATAF